MIRVVKKDGTKEDFNIQKVVTAVNKSAYRALVKFTEDELDEICRFVNGRVDELNKSEVHITDAQCSGRGSGEGKSRRGQKLPGLPEL